MVPYWEDALGPELLAGRTPFVVAHGNSIRALWKFLEDISDDDIVDLEVPTGWPRVVTLRRPARLRRGPLPRRPGGGEGGGRGGRPPGRALAIGIAQLAGP